MLSFLVTALASLAHVLLSGWINLVRGGSHGWLKAPSWFPGRQLTGPIFFAPMLFLVDWTGVLPAICGVAALWLVPSALTIAIQGLGHGSYMDAGTYGQRDNEALRVVLNLIPGLEERSVLDGVTGEPLKNGKGQDVIYDNPLRDFVGGLLKGLLLTAPVAAIWGVFLSSFAPALFLVSGVLYPVAWFANNRWFPRTRKARLFGAPVYWAEIWQGMAFAASVLAVLALI